MNSWGLHQKAIDKSTTDKIELYYYFLLSCFKAGDANKTGTVGLYAFEKMVENVAFAPRSIGLAAKTYDLFPTSERKEYFKALDNDGKGHITFKEWLPELHSYLYDFFIPLLTKNNCFFYLIVSCLWSFEVDWKSQGSIPIHNFSLNILLS